MSTAAFFSNDNPHTLERVRAPEATIYTLPIVLRYDRNNPPSEVEAFAAAAQHMANIMSSNAVQDPNTVWGQRWRAWERQQFRKVTRRAKPGPFEKLRSTEDVIVTDFVAPSGKVVSLLSLTPHEADTPDARLRNFQVSGLSLPVEEAGSFLERPAEPSMLLFPNYAAGASTGKMIAQASHAVQLMIYSSTAEELDLWESGGRKILFSEQLENIDGHEPRAVVTDAGFTEIPPNTKTFKGSWLNL